MSTGDPHPTPWGLTLSRRRLLAASGAVALGFGAAACGSKGTPSSNATGGSSKKTRDVSVMLDYLPSITSAWIWLGKSKGYFAAEGINPVPLTPPQDLSLVTSIVATGRADVALSYIPDLIFARAKNLPVISVANIVKQRADGLLSKEHFHGPRDLRGKAIGNIVGAPDYEAELKQFLKSGGMTEHDVTIVNTGYNIAPSVASGRVAAAAGIYYSARLLLQNTIHAVPGWLNYADYGVPLMPFLILITSESYAHKNADLVRGFVTASARSIKRYLSNRTEAKASVVTCCSGANATAPVADQMDEYDQSISPTNYWLSPGETVANAKYAVQTPNQLEKVLTWSVNIGLAKSVLPPSRYYTNEFVTPQAIHPSV